MLQSWSGRFWTRDKSVLPTGILTSDRLAGKVVARPTTLLPLTDIHSCSLLGVLLEFADTYQFLFKSSNNNC